MGSGHAPFAQTACRRTSLIRAPRAVGTTCARLGMTTPRSRSPGGATGTGTGTARVSHGDSRPPARSEGHERNETGREPTSLPITCWMRTERVLGKEDAGATDGTGKVGHVPQQATQDVVEDVFGARSGSGPTRRRAIWGTRRPTGPPSDHASRLAASRSRGLGAATSRPSSSTRSGRGDAARRVLEDRVGACGSARGSSTGRRCIVSWRLELAFAEYVTLDSTKHAPSSFAPARRATRRRRVRVQVRSGEHGAVASGADLHGPHGPLADPEGAPRHVAGPAIRLVHPPHVFPIDGDDQRTPGVDAGHVESANRAHQRHGADDRHAEAQRRSRHPTRLMAWPGWRSGGRWAVGGCTTGLHGAIGRGGGGCHQSQTSPLLGRGRDATRVPGEDPGPAQSVISDGDEGEPAGVLPIEDRGDRQQGGGESWRPRWRRERRRSRRSSSRAPFSTMSLT